MATIYRCDFCRRIFESSKALQSIVLPTLDYISKRFDSSETKDCCVECMKKIRATIKDIESAANAESATNAQ